MKLKVNIRDLIAQNADHEDLMLAPCSISLDELLDFNGIDDEQEVDLEQLCEENRQVAVIWTTDHVETVRPDLSAEQAWEVLKLCRARWDSRQAIDWEVIEKTAAELFGKQPPRRWHGRIDVILTDAEGYGEGAARSRLCDMATLLSEAPDVSAEVDGGSVSVTTHE